MRRICAHGSEMNSLMDSGPNPLFERVLPKRGHKKCSILGAGWEVNVVTKNCVNILSLNISKGSIKKINTYLKEDSGQ
jgi:hypothetical protein